VDLARSLTEAFPDRKRVGAFWDALSADQFHAAEREAQARQLSLRQLKMENAPYDFAELGVELAARQGGE
jgi:hypothetical protein